MQEKLKKNTPLMNKIIGFLLIITGLAVFVIFTIWIILSKSIKIEEIFVFSNKDNQMETRILNFMKMDKIYCVSLPIFFPILVMYAYFRWTAFSYFKYCDREF